jgi:peroxiredoxin Q/BCP
MAQLRQDYDRFVERETVVVVVGPDDEQAFRQFWEEHHLPFIGLPNPDLSILNMYGQEIKLLKMGRMPTQVIVDKRGLIRYAHYGNAMSDIPENEELLTILEELNAEHELHSS